MPYCNTPVFYNEENATQSFMTNYTMAKNKRENYLRAKAATDFLVTVSTVILGGILESAKDDLGKTSLLSISMAVAFLPPIAAALEKLYEVRRKRYEEVIAEGKAIGYSQNFFYKLENSTTCVSELSGSGIESVSDYMSDYASHSRASEPYSESYSSYSEEQESSTKKDKKAKNGKKVKKAQKDKAKDSVGEEIENVIKKFNEKAGDILDTPEYVKKLKLIEQKLGVKVDLVEALDHFEQVTDIALKGKIIKKTIDDMYDHVTSIKNAKNAESLIKTVGAVATTLLGVAAFVLNAVITETANPSSALKDASTGVNYSIAGIPLLLSLVLFTRVGFYTVFGKTDCYPKCCGVPVDTLSDSFKQLKREAYNNELIKNQISALTP